MKALIVFGLTLMTVCGGVILPRECILDVGFVLDGSGSVQPRNWLLMLSFVENFARRVNFGQSGTRIGVISFGNEATVNVKLNQFNNRTMFEQAVRLIPYKDENTNTASGIRALRTMLFNNQSNGDRLAVPNVAIVLTDGASTWEANNTIPEATRVKNEGVKMFAIGIGPQINMDEVNAIAGDPDEQFVQVVDRFSDLDSLVDVIVNGTCELQRDTLPETFSPDPETTTTSTTTSTTTRPTTTPATTTTTTTTATTTTMTTTTKIPTTTTSTTEISTTTITTTPMTSPTTTTRRSTTTRKPMSSATNMDLLFLLDSSGSISYEKWLLSKDFVKRIVGSVDLSAGNIKVAVIEYSTVAFLSIKLGEYKRQEDFAAAVDRIPYLNHRTNVSGALRLGYREVLNANYTRADAKKVMVVMTDGESNTDAHLTEGEAKAARSMGIKLFTVALGETISIDQLKVIASKPYYYFIRLIDDYANLLNYWYNVANDVLRDEYPEETIAPSLQDCAADLLFLIDVSPPEYDDVIFAVRTLYNSLVHVNGSRHKAFIARTEQPGYQDDEGIIGTDLAQSFQYIRNQVLHTELDRVDAPNFVFVVTNGFSSNVNLLKSETNALKEEGVNFFVVVIGTGSKDEFLREIASDPKSSTFLTVQSASELRERIISYQGTGSLAQSFTTDTCKMSSPVVWTCSFEESDGCGIQDDPDAEFTWTITNRPTPSRHTGPDSAFHGQYYAFIEASNPRKEGDKAVMHLPFSAAGTFCLSFHYHMFGFHIGILDVLIFTNDREDIVWRMSGEKGDEWLYGQTLLRLNEGDRVAIRATRAKEFSGDIGLDLLRIQRGPCVGDI